ncbi:MAG TPA: T9SS type A sorting domain-containing protein [Flavobacteriales bacterium]|nr:T9SS type A sorting domain-containing protein [Flavobacteriales bacterium]
MRTTQLTARYRVLLVLLFSWATLPFCAHAQLRNANWLYVNNNFISFASGTAIASTAPVGGVNSNASLSDPEGNPLVYAFGNTVVNAAFETVSDCPILNMSAEGQGCLLMPVPGDAHGVAFFHIAYGNGMTASPLSFGRINMDLDNGLGGFVGGMTLLTDSATWKLTAVAHTNGQDYWVLTQLFGTDAIAAYLLDGTGVSAVPVVSHTGDPMTYPLNGTPYEYLPGSLVATSDGRRLAMAGMLPQNVEVFNLEHARIDLLDFDPATGIATHAASIPPPAGLTIDGIEFSPDGSKLYIAITGNGNVSNFCAIHQYDLSVWDEASIIASRTEVLLDTAINFYWGPELQLDLAPDGRIWFHNNYDHWLGVIDSPDEAGPDCAPIRDYLLLPNEGGYGLPNQCKRYHDSELTHTGIQASEGAGTLMTWPNPTQGVLNINAPEAGCTSRLYDATGRLVLSAAHGPRRTAIVDVAALPAGPYLLRCTDTLGNSWTSKVVKE